VHSIATLANNIEVYADLTKPPLSLTVGRNPHLLNLIEEVLEKIEPTTATVQIEHDMQRTVGYSEVVTTTDEDTVFYARQTKNAGYTRFVKNGKTESAQHITIILVQDPSGAYEVTNAWIGKFFPALPDGPDETADSKEFWANHAVVHNGQSLISSTITKVCPY
jgi:hypothetical protein